VPAVSAAWIWHTFDLFFLPLPNCQVRVDISARNPGKVQAALTENRRALHELVLEPLREEQYYEVGYISITGDDSCLLSIIVLKV